MQRIEKVSWNQLEKLTKNLRKKIEKDYFQPFIESLQKSALNKAATIQETFRYLQMEDAYFHMFPSADHPVGLLHTRVNDNFKQELLMRPELKENFIRLDFLYLDTETQKHKFPEFDSATIQTCLRELFHDYLNPLPQLKIRYLNTLPKCLNENQMEEDNGDLFNKPAEMQHLIYSYLNHESIFSFKRTCKSAYFLHKAIQGKQANIFYLIAGDVKITRPRKFYEFDLDIPLRKDVSEEDIVSSLYAAAETEDVKIFHSLYHALEYTHFLHHGGHILDAEGEGFMPSLWAVMYNGSRAHLQFTQDNIVLNPKSSSSEYDYNRRDTLISYATVPKHSFQPLLGAVIYPWGNFASYKVFNLVDFGKYMQRENEQSSLKKCIMM